MGMYLSFVFPVLQVSSPSSLFPPLFIPPFPFPSSFGGRLGVDEWGIIAGAAAWVCRVGTRNWSCIPAAINKTDYTGTPLL